MNNIQIVFFDIDGTVFEHDIQDLPKTTYIALEELHKKNIKLCACTSRVRAELINLPKRLLELCDGFIHSAGASIDINHKNYMTYYLDSDDVKKVLEYCKENNIVARWASDDADSCYFDSFVDENVTDVWRYLYNMEPTLKKWDGSSIIHIDTFPPMDNLDPIKQLVKNTNVIILKETVEFTAKDVSKGSSIEKVMNYWNIDANNALAIGDGKNDIDMFKKVGHSIAMGQAQDVVKESASYVTTRIDQDGFYNGIVAMGILEDKGNGE